MNKTKYGRVGLIGVGLMGSSFALALRQAGIVETWVGMDSNPQAIEDALRMGSIQEVTSDLEELALKVDWTVIAVPVQTSVSLARELIPMIDNPHYFLCDVGSTKRRLVVELDSIFEAAGKPSMFVGVHPIAGKEKTGPLFADAELFKEKTIYLTPSAHTAPQALQAVTALWKATGGVVRQIDPETHDDILAVSSHLPHMIAFALMDAVQSGYETKKINHSLGGGLRDMTRVVSSSPEMWSEICLDNSENIIKQMDVFRNSLDELHDLILSRDVERLRAFFTEKKSFRDVLG